MNTKLKRVVGVPVTPAEAMTDYLVDHINAIMISCGIKTIEIQKYTSGFGSRLHVTMAPFEDAPPEVVAQGLVVKDAIAQIMSVVNLARQSVENFSKEEMANVHAMWKASAEASRHPRMIAGAQEQSDKPSDDGDSIPLDLSAVTPDAAKKKAARKPRAKKQ